jgi:hypothetical protein
LIQIVLLGWSCAFGQDGRTAGAEWTDPSGVNTRATRKGASMRLLYCDESNLEERPGDFLIYGGLIVDGEKSLPFSREIDELRQRASVPKEYRLKFNPGPDHLEHPAFLELKQQVIEAAVRHDAKLIVYLILHDVATDPDSARRNGINTVCFHFDCLLNRFGSPGLVLIDRFNDEGNQIDPHLREKFSTGLTGMPYSTEMRLANIVGFHYSAIGQSNFPSVLDIILGSLRFAINAHTRGTDQHQTTARLLLGLLAPLFWSERQDNQISELSLMFSPKVVRIDRYRSKYSTLKDFLSENGIKAAQSITGDREY